MCLIDVENISQPTGEQPDPAVVLEPKLDDDPKLAVVQESKASGDPQSEQPAKKDFSDTFFGKFLILVAGGLLTIGAQSLTTYLTSQNEQRSWAREADFTYQKEMLNKRIDLVERTNRTMARIDYASHLSDTIDGRINYQILRVKMTPKYVPSELMPSLLPLLEKREEVRTEVGTVLSMDGLYFGPKTRVAIANFQQQSIKSKHWYLTPEKSRNAVLAAMQDEIFYNLTYFKSVPLAKH